jgi:sigma-70-like protein
MLLTHDPAATAASAEAGTLECRVEGCNGRLGPWGHARPRRLRLGGGRYETHTPRRVRCRACRGTHVIVSTRSYPRRPDSVGTVGVVLLAAAGGLGHRRIAERVGLPATTVRGWLRRARAQEEHPVLTPSVTHRDEHKPPSTPRVERMSHPNSSLTTRQIRC